MKNQICPIAKTAEIIGDTWIILIVRDILKSPLRFSELERSLDGISSRTLTQKLYFLENEKIIEKNDLHYTITNKGKEVGKIIKAMETFGEKKF